MGISHKLMSTLYFYSLHDDVVLETWTCENCGLVAALNFLEKHMHLQDCQPSSQNNGK